MRVSNRFGLLLATALAFSAGLRCGSDSKPITDTAKAVSEKHITDAGAPASVATELRRTSPSRGQAAPAGSGQGGVRLVRIGDFRQPLHLAQPPGERRLLFVVEQGGRIRVVRGGRALRRPFLDVSGRISSGGERGLLSVAFAPGYRRSRRFYVYYTAPGGDLTVVEYRRSRSSATRADSSSARRILSIEHPQSNHNGGLLLFGPDRTLYIGIGDGGSAGDPDRNGQKLSTLLGKILRISPGSRSDGRPYGIPATNPFVGRDGARPEIYSYGLRNPWRFSFDRATGALSIGDVGQNRLEEVDYVSRGAGRGANFGWSAFEGDSRFNEDQPAPKHVGPIHTYGRSGGCSITGGYVVRDRSLTTLYGRYVYGDFCQGELRSLIPSTGGARGDRALGSRVESLSSFGEDSRGRIYATSLAGPVYRLAPAG